MTIPVTRDHLMAGVMNDSTDCPAHKAIRDATGLPAHALSVTPEGAYIYGVFYRFDDATRARLVQFDLGMAVEPWEFELGYGVEVGV